MLKPERHIWEEDSTHRMVAGTEYGAVWDYAEALEAELAEISCAVDEALHSLHHALVALEAQDAE